MDAVTLASARADARRRLRNLAERAAAKPYLLAFPSVIVDPPATAYTAPGGTSPINGGSPTLVPWKTSRLTALGAVLSKYASAEAGENTINGSWTTPSWAVAFDYYGSDFALKLVNRIDNPEAWLWVDGQPVTAAPEVMTAVTSNQASWYRATFAQAGQHRVVVYLRGFDLAGVDIGPIDGLTPIPKPLVRMSVLGDSWVEGTGATHPLNSVFRTLGRMMDVELFEHGQGGTGYANASTGGKAVYGDAGRVAGVATANPHLIIVSGSSNDDTLTLAGEPAALFSALATACPRAKVIVIGPPMLNRTNVTQRLANRDVIKAAAAAAPNVLGFIDPLDPRGVISTTPAWATATAYAVGDLVQASGFVYEARTAHTSGGSFSASSFMITTWLTGTGKVGATVGDGNCDVLLANDATHPTTEGHEFLAPIYFDRVMELLNTAVAL